MPGRIDPRDVIAGALAAIGSGALGFVVGIVLTFAHRLWTPWGVVIALVLAAALIVGMRLATETRIPVVATTIGVLAATALLSLPGQGGSVLVAADAQGYAWAFGPTLVGLVATAWPRRFARAADDRMGQ